MTDGSLSSLPVIANTRSGSPFHAGLLLESFLISLLLPFMHWTPLQRQWNVYRVSEMEKNVQLYTSNVRSASLMGASSVGCMLSTWDLASATIFLKLLLSLGSHSKMPCWNILTGGPLLLHCLFADGKLLFGQSYDWFPISTLFCNFPFQFVSLTRHILNLNNSALLLSWHIKVTYDSSKKVSELSLGMNPENYLFNISSLNLPNTVWGVIFWLIKQWAAFSMR